MNTSERFERMTLIEGLDHLSRLAESDEQVLENHNIAGESVICCREKKGGQIQFLVRSAVLIAISDLRDAIVSSRQSTD